MCMAYEMRCKCGSGLAGFNFKDNIMTGDVISRLYCPQCAVDIRFEHNAMVSDNGWIIEYDIDVARFQARNLSISPQTITPEFLFTEGYCTWRGIYPTDHIDSVAERADIMKLAKTDPKRYLDEIKHWANKRIERLAKEGWRKANEHDRV